MLQSSLLYCKAIILFIDRRNILIASLLLNCLIKTKFTIKAKVYD